MARITSAAYVATVLRFLTAYNAGGVDACEELLDPDVGWQGVTDLRGREEVRQMLEQLRSRFVQPRVRPEDFREAGGQVLMIVRFHEGDPEAARTEARQSWVLDVTDDGLLHHVVSYERAAEAARAFEAIAPKVHA